MPSCRMMLAALVALAVAVAPVASALAAAQQTAMSAMEDCHGKSANDDACCDKQAACPDTCGATCCKLAGMIAPLPVIDKPLAIPSRLAEIQKPPDWEPSLHPPPPRS